MTTTGGEKRERRFESSQESHYVSPKVGCEPSVNSVENVEHSQLQGRSVVLTTMLDSSRARHLLSVSTAELSYVLNLDLIALTDDMFIDPKSSACVILEGRKIQLRKSRHFLNLL